MPTATDFLDEAPSAASFLDEAPVKKPPGALARFDAAMRQPVAGTPQFTSEQPAPPMAGPEDPANTSGLTPEQIAEADATLRETTLRVGLPAAAALAAPISGGASIPLALGAAGAFTGEVLAQQSEMERGAREKMSTGRLVAAPLAAAIPLGPATGGAVFVKEALTAARPLAPLARGAAGAVVGAGASAIEQGIDTGQIDWGELGKSAAWGALFGGAVGGVETYQATRAQQAALLALRKRTGQWQSTDLEFMDWLRAQRNAGPRGAQMPAEEGGSVPQGQIATTPEGYAEAESPSAPVAAEPVKVPAAPGAAVPRAVEFLDGPASEVAAPVEARTPAEPITEPIPEPNPPVSPEPTVLPRVEEQTAVAPPPEATATNTPAGPKIAPTAERDAQVAKLADKKQLKVQKEFLVEAARNLASEAPREPSGERVTIEVPGDGTFRVPNHQEALTRFADTVEKRFGKQFSLGGGEHVPSPTVTAEAGNRAPTPSGVTPVKKAPTAADLGKAAANAVANQPETLASSGVGTGKAEPELNPKRVLNHVLAEEGFAISTDGHRLFLVAGGKGQTRAELEAAGKGVFPKWKNVVPSYVKTAGGKIAIAADAPKNGFTVETGAALKILHQVRSVLSEKANSVGLFDLGKGKLGFAASAPEVGDYRSEGVTDGMLAITAMNPDFLADAMTAARQAGHESVRVFVRDEVGPVVVVGGDSFAAITMPVRMGAAVHAGALQGGKAPAPVRPVKGAVGDPGPAEKTRQRNALAQPARMASGDGAAPQSSGSPQSGPDSAEAYRLGRARFLGRPKITANSNASSLVAKELIPLKQVERVPFLAGKYTAKFGPSGAAVFDGEKVIASYNFGNALVVDPAYRSKGIASELVYQWRTRFPSESRVDARTKSAQAIQEKVWARIEAENHPNLSRGGSAAPGMPPIPPGIPSARVNYGRMPVAMERIAPGTVDVPTILTALGEVAKAAGSHTDFREGRFYQQALGIAKQWEEIIRLRALNNLPTAAHEIGHIVSKGLFGSMLSKAMIRAMPTPVKLELDRLGRALYGSRRPVAGYTAEGFAELTRLWVSTEDAATKAPAATKWIEETLFPMQSAKAPYPELGAALRHARDLFDVWRSQGSEGRIAAQTKEEPGRIARLKAWAKENLSARGVAEEFSPLEELAKAYAATTGNRLAPGDNPYLIATALRATAGARLETWVEHGMTNIEGTVTGPSLKEAVAPVKARDAEKFELYLTAVQAIERFKQGKNPGIEGEDAVYVRDKYAKEHPEFVGAADKVADWWNGVLQYKRDAYPAVNGPIVDAVRAGNPRYYGPLARVLDPERVRASSAQAQGGGLHRFKGSGLPIKKIVLQSLRVAEGMIADAHRDMILRSVVNLARTEGMGWVIEEVPKTRVMEQVNVEKLRRQLENMGVDTTSIPPDTLLEYASHRDTPTGIDPIITVRTGADTKWYQVPAQVFEILQGVQEPARLGLVFELFAGMPARAFKLGTTGLRASFSMVTNPARDFPTFMLQSIAGNPASRAANHLRALFDIVRAGLGGNQSPAWELVHQLGLQSSTFLGGDIAQTRRAARSLFHGTWYRRLTSPVETLREILSVSESAPRLAELTMLGRELGWKPGQPLTRDQAVALMVAFKRVTTDFSAKGSQWRAFYRAVPFSSANVQGARSFGRAFKRDQGTKEKSHAAVRAILSGLTLLTLPALYNWWRNKDEEWYQMLPWRERYLYLNVAGAGGKNVYQIPLPQEWGAAFAVLPIALMESWYRADPRAMQEAARHLFEVLNPVDYPVLAKAAKEQWRNQVDFFDRPIVPRGELDLLPGMQRSAYSSELGKELGDIFPRQVSPRRFDAAVRQVFGGVGSDVGDAPGALMRALGLQSRDKPRDFEISDTPIFGRLARRGGGFTANSQPLVEFWDDYNRFTSWHASNQRAIRDRKPVLVPMNFRQQAYASRLEALEPWIKLRLEIAERTPELAKRQAVYQAASERAAKLLGQRPPE